MATEEIAVWRPSPVVRVFVLAGFGLLTLLIVIGLLFSPGTWIGYPFVAVLVFVLLGIARRRCTLTSTEIVAQGRFVRRVIPLAEITQVAQDLTLSVWVRTRTARFNGGDVCMLRMIPTTGAAVSGEAAGEAVHTLRRAAERAGAILEPLPDKRVPTGSKKPLVFSI